MTKCTVVGKKAVFVSEVKNCCIQLNSNRMQGYLNHCFICQVKKFKKVKDRSGKSWNRQG